MSTIYSALSISKKFETGNSSLSILKNINIELKKGEISAIVGASGSGKTTLLQILGTLATPSSGELRFNNQSLSKKTDKELADFRNKTIGFIFQFHHLLPEFTALENVMMPALISGKKPSQITERAKDLLVQVELGHRLKHKVNELSGGEQQRTALARALVMAPAMLLADEPTGNLDSRAGNMVFELLQSLSAKMNLTTLMVTHNMELAKKMDSCYTLRDGTLYS